MPVTLDVDNIVQLKEVKRAHKLFASSGASESHRIDEGLAYTEISTGESEYLAAIKKGNTTLIDARKQRLVTLCLRYLEQFSSK